MGRIRGLLVAASCVVCCPAAAQKHPRLVLTAAAVFSHVRDLNPANYTVTLDPSPTTGERPVFYLEQVEGGRVQPPKRPRSWRGEAVVEGQP